MMRIAHILVVTDLTERSELAIQRALQLQKQMGATLMLLHVIEPGNRVLTSTDPVSSAGALQAWD